MKSLTRKKSSNDKKQYYCRFWNSIQKIIKIHWFYRIKNQQIWKWINQMNIIFQNKKQTSFTFLVIFIVKSRRIEILNKDTVNSIQKLLKFWFYKIKFSRFESVFIRWTQFGLVFGKPQLILVWFLIARSIHPISWGSNIVWKFVFYALMS